MNAYSVTFGDRAESHVGMQIIGTLANRGLTHPELSTAKEKFESAGFNCTLINLTDLLQKNIIDAHENDLSASVLVIKQGVNALLNDKNGANNLYEELNNLQCDSKAVFRGVVKNKNARHNLCFGED